MRKLIFDTNSIDLLFQEKLPLKWKKYWQEIKNNTSKLLLFEILITEIFYKLSRTYGSSTMEHKILQLKSLESLKFIEIDDNFAILAGKMVIKYQKYGLSIVDSYIVACGKKFGGLIISTDPGIKKACKEEKVKNNFIPLKAILKK